LEKTLYLNEIDPVAFYGINNSNLRILANFFPKIQFIARGNELKTLGDESEIKNFETRFQVILDYYKKYNSISENTLEDLLNASGEKLPGGKYSSEDVLVFGNSGRIIKARTENQKKLVKAYEKNDLVFAIGPAGSGKTYTAIALAVRSLKNREIRKIILTRPAVEAGENLGFLPGDMKEKLDPYLQPLYDALNDMIPAKKLADYINDGVVQIAPLAFMRGRTLDNACVILDEAQNTTENQLKMFLTRMGSNAKFMVTGDITQIDLPNKVKSGLITGLEILKNVKGISSIHFNNSDIIRHKLVKDIVKAYNIHQESNPTTKKK